MGKWQAGPALLVVSMAPEPGGWGFGTLAQHWSSYAGDDDRADTSLTNCRWLREPALIWRTAGLPDNLMMRSIQRNFHPKRSGDIYLVFEPNVFINDFDGLTVTSTHGSPWRYDAFVPVIFARAGVRQARVNRSVTLYDIAPTLSDHLGVKPPSGTIGAPLVEVSENR